MPEKLETLKDGCIAGAAFVTSASLQALDEVSRIILTLGGIVLVILRIVKLIRHWNDKGDVK